MIDLKHFVVFNSAQQFIFVRKVAQKVAPNINRLKRHPDVIIGDDYLHRWFIIPRNPIINIYLNKFHNSDDDRALHDHPWHTVSFLLAGELKEIHLNGIRLIPRFIPVFRSAKFAHRIELVKGPATTLFITGPKIREWGFHCAGGWVHWKDYTGTVDDSNQHEPTNPP